MDSRKLYLFYFMYGAINTIAIQMLPLAMTQKGFNNGQITIALSCVFLAALLQPVIGHLTSTKVGSKPMIKMLLITILITSIFLFSTALYIPILIVIFMFSVARLSISPLYDSYATMAANHHNINFGLVRSGASLGFGVGMFIYAFIANIFNLDYSSSFLFITTLSIIGMYLISSLPKEGMKFEDNTATESKTELPKAVLLIMMYVLYFGALNVRFSYNSLFFSEFGRSTEFISLATFFMVIPELIFLPLYNKLFARFNKMYLLYAAVLLGITQMVLYIMFPQNTVMLLFASMFNGFQIMVFFPTFFGMLQTALGARNSAFGFVINTTLTSLFVGVFNIIAIRPIFLSTDTTISVFYIIIILQLCSFIPLFIYHRKYYGK